MSVTDLSIELTLEEVSERPMLAAGSVFDVISDRIAKWAQSALMKERVEDLTEQELLALAVCAGCQLETKLTQQNTWRLSLAHRVAVARVDGQWQVHEEADAPNGAAVLGEGN